MPDIGKLEWRSPQYVLVEDPGQGAKGRLGNAQLAQKDKLREITEATIVSSRVTQCSTSHCSSAAASKGGNGIRIPRPAADISRQMTPSASRQSMTCGLASPSAHSRQRAGTASQARQPPVRKALAPSCEDVEATGTGWQIGDRHDRHLRIGPFGSNEGKPIY